MTPPSIGIVGRRRAGKDSVADYLVREHGYVRVGFADAVKRAALALNPLIPSAGSSHDDGLDSVFGPLRLSSIVDTKGWEFAKDGYPEVRRILQHLGDEAGRQIHGEDTWVDQAMSEITRHRLCGRPVVVPDVRYSNEVNVLRAAGFTLVHLTRPSVSPDGPADLHASESGIDELQVDAHISNSGTLEGLFSVFRAQLAL